MGWILQNNLFKRFSQLLIIFSILAGLALGCACIISSVTVLTMDLYSFDQFLSYFYQIPKTLVYGTVLLICALFLGFHLVTRQNSQALNLIALGCAFFIYRSIPSFVTDLILQGISFEITIRALIIAAIRAVFVGMSIILVLYFHGLNPLVREEKMEFTHKLVVTGVLVVAGLLVFLFDLFSYSSVGIDFEIMMSSVTNTLPVFIGLLLLALTLLKRDLNVTGLAATLIAVIALELAIIKGFSNYIVNTYLDVEYRSPEEIEQILYTLSLFYENHRNKMQIITSLSAGFFAGMGALVASIGANVLQSKFER